MWRCAFRLSLPTPLVGGRGSKTDITNRIVLEAGTRIVKYNLLILGASYGSLFGTKLLMAGHRVILVCTRPTAELINREGTVVRFPIKGRESLLDIASKKL